MVSAKQGFRNDASSLSCSRLGYSISALSRFDRVGRRPRLPPAHAPVVVIMLGAIAGMLPDPLQFVHSLHPHEPLATLQRFHWWIHSKRKLDWPIGVCSQIIFAAVSGQRLRRPRR
jgi:hypothetical protein